MQLASWRGADSSWRVAQNKLEGCAPPKKTAKIRPCLKPTVTLISIWVHSGALSVSIMSKFISTEATSIYECFLEMSWWEFSNDTRSKFCSLKKAILRHCIIPKKLAKIIVAVVWSPFGLSNMFWLFDYYTGGRICYMCYEQIISQWNCGLSKRFSVVGCYKVQRQIIGW